MSSILAIILLAVMVFILSMLFNIVMYLFFMVLEAIGLGVKKLIKKA